MKLLPTQRPLVLLLVWLMLVEDRGIITAQETVVDLPCPTETKMLAECLQFNFTTKTDSEVPEGTATTTIIEPAKHDQLHQRETCQECRKKAFEQGIRGGVNCHSGPKMYCEMMNECDCSNDNGSMNCDMETKQHATCLASIAYKEELMCPGELTCDFSAGVKNTTISTWNLIVTTLIVGIALVL